VAELAHELNFIMPSLGADMERGRVGAWRVKPGDRIRRGQVIVDVDTDKGLIDVECFHDAVVVAILAAEGTEVPVGAPIARLQVDGAATSAPTTSAPAPTTPSIPPPTPTSTPVSVPTTTAPPMSAALPSPGARVVASPLAKRRARELGVDLARVTPGPEGRITAEDVERAATAAPVTTTKAPETPPKDPKEAMRRAIAASMSRSKREIPHYYLWQEVDVTATVAWLKAENARRSLGDRLLFAALVARAVAQTAKAFPDLNGTCDDGVHRPSDVVHLGFATSQRGGGLIAPAILNADSKDISAMMVAINDLVARVRSGGLRGSEMTSGTITVSALGDTGVDGLLPVIQPPQLAIVGAGRMMDRAVVRDGQVVVRTMMTISVAADHRVSDGARGARFLLALDKALSTPPAAPTERSTP
jgi:pyruvate dehydrogenase E2 component (dihydrolipoamide acetyltransferase)